jgi:hypothetical protein
MMELQPDEIVLTGNWLVEGGSVTADDVCRRIEWLIESRLEHLAADSSGWDTLYRDPRDGRLWEHTYSQGEMHGGGPPQLKVVSPENAAAKYRVGSA